MVAPVRTLSDILTIFRRAIGRRNENDPDSSDPVLVRYINDFYALTMSDDVKLFENFGALTFTIDETNTTGVYDIADIEDADTLVNMSQQAFISLLDPVENSISWNILPIWRDPGDFFATWGINNSEILIPGYPTEVLLYGNELTFRTIPNTSYQVKIFGYKQNVEFEPGDDPEDENLPFGHWLRYIAYGAAQNYARDFRYSAEDRGLIQEGFKAERKWQLTRMHNQIKPSRAYPRF
jgi:hypothetical protein